jgi:hypothetical protein
MADGKPGAPRVKPYLDEFREWMDDKYKRRNQASIVSNARLYLEFLDECEEWPPEMVAALEKRIGNTVDQIMSRS